MGIYLISILSVLHCSINMYVTCTVYMSKGQLKVSQCFCHNWSLWDGRQWPSSHDCRESKSVLSQSRSFTEHPVTANWHWPRGHRPVYGCVCVCVSSRRIKQLAAHKISWVHQYCDVKRAGFIESGVCVCLPASVMSDRTLTCSLHQVWGGGGIFCTLCRGERWSSTYQFSFWRIRFCVVVSNLFVRLVSG